MDKDVNPSEELLECSEFIGVNANEVIIKARVYMFFTLIVSAIGLALIVKNFLGTMISVVPALIAYYYVTEKPKIKARQERLRSLGHAPEIITVLGTSLELNPNLERAVRLVSETCGGRISNEFKKAYKDSILKGVPLKDSFKKIINEWGSYSEGFRQGTHLINTSLLERESRERTIDNGMNAFFNGLINDLRKFLAKTKTHTLVLFSFGTIIPLIVISMLPIVSLLNIETNPLMIGLFLTLNLLGINYYAGFIINNRPATFSQVDLTQKSEFIAPLIPYSLLLFFIISSPTLLYYGAMMIGGAFPLPKEYASMPLIIVLSVGLSVYFYGRSKSLMKTRNKAISAEKEVLDITYSLGGKLQEKRSFEDALKHVINENKGKELTYHLKKAYNNIKELQTPHEEAVMKELSRTGSKRVSSVFGLIFHALRQGVENSARSVFRIYEHFSRMVQTENEHKALLEQVLSMMKVTAIIFAPLISAFIVMMQGMIEANVPTTDLQGYGLNFYSGMSLEVMQLLLGLYTIGLVIVLTRYYVQLNNGPDKVILNHELSNNIITACLIYLGTLVFTQLVL